MNNFIVKRLLLSVALVGLLFAGGGVLADTFIGGHRLFFDRVDDRGVTDNQILKYDAASNKWLPDSDDVGEDTSLPSNDTASATLRGNDAGDGWEQNTSLKSTSGGVVTLTGASAQIVLEKGGSEAATIAGDDLIIRDVDGSGADVGISILTDAGTDAFAGVYFGSGTVEHNGWIRSKDTYMDLRVDETTWISSLSTQTNLKLPVLFENTAKFNDDKTLTFGTENDITIQYDENGNDDLQITGAVGFDGAVGFASTLTVTGATTLNGGLTMDTNKFTVADTSGNTLIGGTLGVTGATTLAALTASGTAALNNGITVDTTAFTVANTSGNTATTGTLTVGGATALNGGLTMDTDKFTVADTSGNTGVGGTLTVTGATTLNGGLVMDTDKFTVADTSGNTAIGGTLGVTGDVTVNTNKFTVAAASGNTEIAGTLEVTGATTLGSLAAGGISIGNIAGTGRFTMADDVFGAADSTPSITSGMVFYANNAGVVNISDLDDGVDGQIVIIVGTHNTNTCNFDDGVQFYLSADHDLGAGDTLTLVYDATGDVFYELAYSDN